MRLGLISDTHGYLDPRVLELFAGVDRILHAGDIGDSELVEKLEAVAPTTAVLGNNDLGLHYRLTELVEAGDLRILVHHIVDPAQPGRSIGPRYGQSHPQVVVFGHTHRPYHAVHDGVTFLNPGYSGKPRFSLERSVAIAEVTSAGLQVTHHRLSRPAKAPPSP